MSADRPHRERALNYFLLLDHEGQRAAIRRMAAAGSGDYVIASATGLSVEMIRAILTARAPSAEGERTCPRRALRKSANPSAPMALMLAAQRTKTSTARSRSASAP